jgi:succinoglycan biosynthesis protein ExoV
MHAAILADAFRVPWVAVTTSRVINSFKWEDWATSLQVAYRPRRVPISSRAEAVTKGARFWGVDFDRKVSTEEDEDPNRRDFGETLVMTREPPRSMLRSVAKQVLAAPSVLVLRQARKAAPQLSADVVLDERKSRFREVLAGIRRDYF